MSPQILDVISIPVMAGIVGYITNRLAIKMLFRPYYPKWYSLGWQGIVPRSRSKLASLIGDTVAKKLLSPEDIASSIFKKESSSGVSGYIQMKLSSITPSDIAQTLNSIDLEAILENNKTAIDDFGIKFITETANEYLKQRFPVEKIMNILRRNIQKDETSAFIVSKFSDYIREKLNSEKKLSDILPSSITSRKQQAVTALTEKTSDMIKNMGRSIIIKEAVAKKIVGFKNSFFAGNQTMDFLKMGFVNIVLGDDTISNAVKRELPGVMDGIADDINVRSSISSKINEEIDALLSSTVKEINKKVSDKNGTSFAEDISTSVNSPETRQFIKQSLSSIIESYELKYQNMTNEEALNNFGFDFSAVIKNFRISSVISENIEKIKSVFCLKTSEYIDSNSEKIAVGIAEKLERFLKEGLPIILKNGNIAGSVEDKINAMPLEEVENVLFSFMKDHFKWINRLGFILGFIIGAAQVVGMYLLH